MLQIHFLPTPYGVAHEVRLAGELDRFSAETLRALAQLDGDLELDCFDLDVRDTGGLSALLTLQTACAARGDRLVLHGFTPPASGLPGWYRAGMFDADADVEIEVAGG